MRFFYVRPTKMHPEAEQRRVLGRVEPDEWYVEEKPKRGESSWYWFGKLARACRPGSEDEIHVSHASVMGSTAADALARLMLLTERGATLVVASTGERFRYHPDAAAAIGMARQIEGEARAAIQQRATRAAKDKAAERRKRKAAHWAKTKRRWLEELTTSGVTIAKEQGYSRAYLNKRLGPRGTERFKGGPREQT